MSFHARTRKPYARPASSSRGQNYVPAGPRAGLDNANALGRTANTSAASSNTRLLVSNLHYEITPKDLSSIFGQIGTLVREPNIRYDRSGRSSGTAIIYFETPTEATRAKKQFDGILAKGQPMSIAYDTEPIFPPQRRRSARVPTSLLNRIQKTPLLERVSRDERFGKKSAPAAPRGGVGPTRSHARVLKKAKTAEELDKELDAFMGDANASGSENDGKATAQDIDMA